MIIIENCMIIKQVKKKKNVVWFNLFKYFKYIANLRE